MRILLVEDDESIREILKLILENQSPFFNLSVETASNGQEALDRLQEISPDIVLLDLTLPEGDGFEIFKKMKKFENFKDLPVIALTAHNLIDLKEEAKALGFAGYVTKPIDFDDKLYPLMRQIAKKRAA